jgi:hypothetical protein
MTTAAKANNFSSKELLEVLEPEDEIEDYFYSPDPIGFQSQSPVPLQENDILSTRLGQPSISPIIVYLFCKGKN